MGHPLRRRERRRQLTVRRTAAALAGALLLAGCSGGVTLDQEPDQHRDIRSISVAHDPDPARPQLDDDDPADLALTTSQTYFESAQIAVLAPVSEPADSDAAMWRAASIGAAVGAPVLLTGAAEEESSSQMAGGAGALNTELVRLGTRALLTVGDVNLDDIDTNSIVIAPDPQDDSELSNLLGRSVHSTSAPTDEDAVQALTRLKSGEIFDADDLDSGPDSYGTMPATAQAQQLSTSAVIVGDDPIYAAAVGTARAAGAQVSVAEEPLRGDAALVSALGQLEPDTVVGMGTWASSAAEFDELSRSLSSGHELPGGGQLVFGTDAAPLRYVSLYGSAQSDRLGPLGAHSATETMGRARELAENYTSEWDTQVVPSVEILATVASDHPGRSGRYSHMWPAADIEPWIQAAADEGVYVLLTFQPGRYSFIDQIRQYSSLLEYPNVGVRLEPQWRYTQGQIDPRNGSVDAGEINDVVVHLDELVRQEQLPQKLVSITQTAPGQIRHRPSLITDNDLVPLLINTAARGASNPDDRDQAWTKIRADAPAPMWWGYTVAWDEDTQHDPADLAAELDPLPDWVTYR